ncbi:MAG TPA: type II toxin-antitoxin system prevent-host-death family antitoxin [Polyangia bacterium]|nr:type II toxin-antitoxin system prevent-host-death family antitoxin [Polyangia bacterium]
MKTVSVSDLKAHLSHYLRMVQRGSEVQILDRGVPVARLVAVNRAAEAADGRLERLVAAGIVRRGTGSVRRFLSTPPIAAADADLQGALSDDREDRV